MDTDEPIESNVEQNLARLLHNALREAGTRAGYALDAEAAGDKRLAGFFREAQKTYTNVAEGQEKCSATGAKSNLRLVFG